MKEEMKTRRIHASSFILPPFEGETPMRVCVFEDVGVALLTPLALTRPVFDLRCGALSLLERQRQVLGLGRPGSPLGLLVRPQLEALTRVLAAEQPVNDRAWLADGPGPLLLVNGRWLAPEPVEAPAGRPEVGLVGEQVAWVVLPAGAVVEPETFREDGGLEKWKESLPTRPAGGVMIDYPWTLVENNARALELDCKRARGDGTLPEGAVVVGPRDRLWIDATARVEPLSYFDTTHGPIWIDRGAIVQAFSRLDGPCYIGPETHILAGRVKGASIGPHCRIGGEVEVSIVQGYTNKAHDGFLGHSYVGEWVNLGAGTHTSDLRNDYSRVGMVLDGHKVDTGLLKVGSFIGDHTKTSIGTLFNTGSLIGPFGQLVASGNLMPRYLPPFCQVNNGRITERTDLGRIFQTAATAMGRRNFTWTEHHAEFFVTLYEQTEGARKQLLQDNEQRRQRRSPL
jgi:UDP-N-acetylglucosamine diphosphorylase/glucosamine-1-phosphate N-acetyltransferase